METSEQFNKEQIEVVNQSVEMAEELVCNFYKLSVNQLLRHRYDIKTMVDLSPDEIIYGAFAQVIRYEGRKKDTTLGSASYDFYKICIQDHSIISAIRKTSGLNLFAFTLYIIIHELVHIIRFSRFLQNFEASPGEKLAEEARVHEKTLEILSKHSVAGIREVLDFCNKSTLPIDNVQLVKKCH